MVQVRDNGDGVPAEDAGRIFEAYRRSDSNNHASGSVGLGLSVTRQLAKLMDGDISYERPDGSTVFRLTLPIG